MIRIFKLNTIASVLLAAIVFAACSNENNTEAARQDDNNELPTTQFSFTEEPFGSDTEVATRSNEVQPNPEYIDLGDQFEAEVTTERDPKVSTPSTRAIDSDTHYTIVAFKASTTTEVGEIKGKFKAATHSFVPDPGTPRILYLTAGERYDFIAYTDQYGTREGKTIKFLPKDTEKGRYGVIKNLLIMNAAQHHINFRMNLVSTRIRTKIVAYDAIPADVKAKLVLTAAKEAVLNVDPTIVLDGSAKGLQAYPEVEQTYNISGTYRENEETLNTKTAKEYGYALAGTTINKIQLQFTSGKIYSGKLAGGARTLKAVSALKPSESWTIRIKIMPRYKYLFEDGVEGYRSDPTRANHTPIALCLGTDDETGKKLAMSIWTKPNVPYTNIWMRPYQQDNNTSPYGGNITKLVNDTTSGFAWTWETSGNPSGKIKANEQTEFPLFYEGGHFYNYISSKLPAGQTLAPALNQDRVWFVPSISAWIKYFTLIGLGDKTKFIPYYLTLYDHLTWGSPWKYGLANHALTAAGGDGFVSREWSSSEYTIKFMFAIHPSGTIPPGGPSGKALAIDQFTNMKTTGGGNHLRAFVVY